MTLDRVLIVSPSAGLGGAERVLLDLVRAQRPNRTGPHRAVLVLEEGPLIDELVELGVEHSCLPLPRSLGAVGESQRASATALGLLRAASSLPSYLLQFRSTVEALAPSVVHTNGMKAHVLAAAAGIRVPVVWHLHDFVGDRRVTRPLLTLASRMPARALANSHAVAEDARASFGRLPIDVAWNGVDLERFRPDLARRRRLGGSTDVVHVGLVATYARWKGHDVFLAAARKALDALGDGVHFVVVGGPVYTTAGSQWCVEELSARVVAERLEDHVTFVPFQRDPVHAFQALDVVVHASTRREPFGRVIVEGMACGAAVVATRGGGVDEIVRPDVDGLLVPPGDARTLADAIVRLVRDEGLRTRLADAGRARASEFSLARFDDEVVACWERALA